jgi:ubiquinone/menaquinone biosynthesis C-methylase UbiE
LASKLIAPNIEVKANVVKAAAQNLPFEDNSFDLVYTCTLMMHVPYIAAVLAAAEFARVSSKYVLHVEGYHTDGIVRNFKSKYNFLLLDYQRLYEKLGFRMVKEFFYQDPYSTEYDYIVYLGEKNI